MLDQGFADDLDELFCPVGDDVGVAFADGLYIDEVGADAEMLTLRL